MNRKFFTQNKIRDLPADRQIESMQSCYAMMIDVDTYTTVIGSTITSRTIIDPPGTYNVDLKIDEVTINTVSIATDSSGTVMLPFVTTGQPPGLHNLTVEVIGPYPNSCSSHFIPPVALTTAAATCAGITIDAPSPITVYVGDILSIPVTATGVTEQSIIEFRETTTGQGGMVCTISPPGGSCTLTGSTTEIPPELYGIPFYLVASIGNGPFLKCVSDPIELTVLPSTSVCTSITTPTATPSTVTIGDTVTLRATAYPTTSIFSVAFKDQNNIVLGTANTISGVATIQWNTAGKTAGIYNIKAHVGIQCSSQTARAVTLNTPGACTITMIEADTYTAITGSTITLTTIIDPPGIYDVNLKVDGVTVNTVSITTDSYGMATLPFVTTGQPPGLHNLRVEVIGPSPMSCESGVDVALTTAAATCTGITIDAPSPITVYIGDILSIPVTATGVTEQSVIEFRDTASGQGGTVCTISPPGGQCIFSGSVPIGTPSGIYHTVASIGNGPFLKCVSDPIELIVLQSASACTSITTPTATPSTVTIGDTVTLTATVQPTTSIFSVSFKDQNNNVLGTANTVSGVATIQWNTAGKAAGTYNIKARVGTQCSSPTRAVTINTPTCTSITTPITTLTTVIIGGTVTLTATAQPTTSIFTVSFKDQNNNVLGTANTVGGVATIQWNTAGKTAGIYNIKAHVGIQCSSLTAVTVTLDIPTTACTSITAPTATPTIVTIGEVVNLSATAEPTTATFTVDFKDQNNNVIGSENTSSGIASYVWNTGGVSAGTYSIKAYVGIQCVSSEPATVTVNQTTVACISVTTPLAIPSSVTIGELVALRATVQPTTSIYTVSFKDQDNNVIGSANTLDGVAAYNWDTTGKIAKIYQINAYAGTCASPTAVAVTLSTVPGTGGGIGMLVGLVGVAALGMMMFKPKPK